jgi:DNA-binding IclR family transcriptional regulator
MAPSSLGRIAPALDRGLTILEHLAAHSGETLSLACLSRELGMPKSSLFRLLATLERRGYVERDRQGAYRIGAQILSFQTVYRPWPRLMASAYPIMHALAQEARETCHLAVLSQSGPVYLEKIEGPRPFTVGTRVGGRVAHHASAVGKVLLSELAEDELAGILEANGLPRLTSNTITSAESLVAHLALVREHGYALDDEEEEAGVTCLAAPIRDSRGKIIAALSLTGLSPGFGPCRVEILAGLTRDAADRISSDLGYALPNKSPEPLSTHPSLMPEGGSP